MAITVQAVVTEARGLLQDTLAAYRFSDADLVTYLNDCLDVIAEYKPDLFYEIREHTCAAGARQQFDATGASAPVAGIVSTGSKGVVDVLQTRAGAAITKCERSVLEAFQPSWRTSNRAGTPTNWMDVNKDRFLFDLCPPPTPGLVLHVQHVAIPPEYGIGGTLDSRLTQITHLLVDYMVGMAEAREAEDVGPQREQIFLANFQTKLKMMPK